MVTITHQPIYAYLPEHRAMIIAFATEQNSRVKQCTQGTLTLQGETHDYWCLSFSGSTTVRRIIAAYALALEHCALDQVYSTEGASNEG